MKRLILNLFLVTILTFVVSPTLFAAIPISEIAQQEIVQPSNTEKLESNKTIKLKDRIVQKLLKKKMEEGTRTAAIIMAILIPFVGVAIWQDGISRDFWITLALTAFLYLPGLIYALTIILNAPSY